MFNLQDSKVSLVFFFHAVKYLLVPDKYSCNMILFFYVDLLGPSIAAYVIAVWHALTITVDGWLGILKFSHFMRLFVSL